MALNLSTILSCWGPEFSHLKLGLLGWPTCASQHLTCCCLPKPCPLGFIASKINSGFILHSTNKTVHYITSSRICWSVSSSAISLRCAEVGPRLPNEGCYAAGSAWLADCSDLEWKCKFSDHPIRPLRMQSCNVYGLLRFKDLQSSYTLSSVSWILCMCAACSEQSLLLRDVARRIFSSTRTTAICSEILHLSSHMASFAWHEQCKQQVRKLNTTSSSAKSQVQNVASILSAWPYPSTLPPCYARPATNSPRTVLCLSEPAVVLQSHSETLQQQLAVFDLLFESPWVWR